MSDDMLFEVRQAGLPSLGDYQLLRAPLLKMGVPVVATIWDYLALSGYMFNLQETTTGTPLTGDAVNASAIVLTAPGIRFTVPTGVTVFPHRLNLALETAAGTLNELAVVVSDGDSYTSGGTALTPKNWRTDDLRATTVTNVYCCSGSAIVEAALTNVRSLWKYVRPAAFTAGETFDGLTTVVWRDIIPVIGPASVLVYLGAATTALTYMFSMDWAEVPSGCV